MVAPLRPAVVDQLPFVLVLLGVQDKVAAKGREVVGEKEEEEER